MVKIPTPIDLNFKKKYDQISFQIECLQTSKPIENEKSQLGKLPQDNFLFD